MQPLGEGYIALVLPKLGDGAATCNALVSEEKYEELKKKDV